MSSFFLKIFALIFMIIDHVGFIIFPKQIIFRIIGRLAFPLFAYQMAVGFSHTKNKEKHILKLLLFAIICQVPTFIITNLYSVQLYLNIIFTFVIALLIIYTVEKVAISGFEKHSFNTKNILFSSIIIVFLLAISILLKVDYTWYGVLLTVAFYFTLKNKALSLLLFFILVNINFVINQNLMNALAYFSLFACIFILLFNGKRGYKMSWLFYALYFLHFFPIFLIEHYIRKYNLIFNNLSK